MPQLVHHETTGGCYRETDCSECEAWLVESEKEVCGQRCSNQRTAQRPTCGAPDGPHDLQNHGGLDLRLSGTLGPNHAKDEGASRDKQRHQNDA